MATDLVRALKIKTGVVRRTHKDLVGYEQEAESLAKQLGDSAADETSRRQTQRLLDESRRMVADCRNRLAAARAELEQLLENEELAGTAEFQDAKGMLAAINN